MFEQWLKENALSSPFRLAELSRQHGILSTIVGLHGELKIVKLTKTCDNPLANEVDGKYYILPSFTETEFIEEKEDVENTEVVVESEPTSKRKSAKTTE